VSNASGVKRCCTTGVVDSRAEDPLDEPDGVPYSDKNEYFEY
jgi:hypothetical protein